MNFPLPFWRKDPLTKEEDTLLKLVLEAHFASADRNNISSDAVRASAFGSGDYTKAIASALLTLGGIHAPLELTYEMLMTDRPADAATHLLASGKLVPGWGNSFERGHDDPLWLNVIEWFQDHRPAFYALRIEAVTKALALYGKNVFPNPSAFTAATAIVLQIPQPIAAFLFVAGRLPAWTNIFLNHH